MRKHVATPAGSDASFHSVICVWSDSSKEEGIGRRARWIGNLQARRSVGFRCERFGGLAATALEPMLVVAHVDEKMFYGAQRETPGFHRLAHVDAIDVFHQQIEKRKGRRGPRRGGG